jgi:hypothetical protein
MCKSSRAV